MNRISVIVPVYNGIRYLQAALNSVLGQTRPADEIIVVNDGSTDGTAELLNALEQDRLTVIHQDNRGAADARNRGIQASHGNLIAFLDADDLWEPEKLRIQETFMDEHPDIGYVCCRLAEFHADDLTDEQRAHTPLRTGDQVATLPSTAMVRISVLDRTGLFDPRWKTGEFLDWCLRAVESGILKHQLPEILVHRRIHDRNLGRTAAARTDYHRIIKASLDRRRGKTP